MSEKGEEIGHMIDHPNFVCQKCGKIHRKVKTEEAIFGQAKVNTETGEEEDANYRALVWKCDLCGYPHEIETLEEERRELEEIEEEWIES